VHQIVVANVENDADVAAVARDVTHVPIEANVGYAAAVNAGVRAATGIAVAFMNDDVVVEPGDLQRLALLVTGSDADVAVPQVVDATGEVERTIAALPTPATLAREWLLLPDQPLGTARRTRVEKWRLPVVVEEVSAASAMLVVTRREVLERHPLPEAYFLYWEEAEWFWWLREAGLRTVYEPAARCVHVGGRREVRSDKSRLLARNAVRCVRRTQGRLAALAAWPVVVLWNLRLVVSDAVRLPAGRTGAARVAARLAGLGAAAAALAEVWAAPERAP
jgi:GT2 family glycosyltransferase